MVSIFYVQGNLRTRASKSDTPVKVVILPLLASLSLKWLEIDWQFSNRNCYKLSRISLALAQISCLH